MPSNMRPSTRAMSLMLSPLPKRISCGDITCACAPSSAAAMEKAVRVRQDGRWKIRQKFRSVSERGKMRARFLRFSSIACDSSACTCSGENSSSVIRLMPFIEFDIANPNGCCKGRTGECCHRSMTVWN
jgi:hypothetical protein